jgi:serine protease Do
LLGTDHLTYLALNKVEATGLPFLQLADSGDLQQGELVMAFGSPLGLENSVSLGVISSTARQVSLDDPRVFLQTDAAINPGNSGGPLVNAQGRVVGIDTFILTQSGGSEGIGFAIPSNVVKNISTQLQREGHVHRGQIGVYAKAITPALAQGLKLPQTSGVVIEDVTPGGPAEKAGLKVGDIVLSIAGHPITSIPRFAVSLFEYQIGETAAIEVLRNGQRVTMRVPVVEAQNDPQRFADLADKENIIAQLGIVGLTVDQKLQQQLPDLRIASGVLVAAQAAGAQYSGDNLKAGDIIHRINQTPVTTVGTLKDALNALDADASVVLQVERDGSLTFVVLEPE